MLCACRALLATGLALLAACDLTGADGLADLAIRHVSVVDVSAGALLTDRTILVHDGRIVRIDSALEDYPAARQVIDGTGHFVMPGLWDMHVHAGGDESTYQQLLAWGVTSVRDMGSPLAEVRAVRLRREDHPASGPRIVYGGFALRGPGSASDTGAGIVADSADVVAALLELQAGGASFVKVHEGISEPTWTIIAREARAQSLPVVGHVPSGLSPAKLAEAGLQGIEHLEFLPDRCLGVLGPARRGSRVPSGCDSAAIDALLRRLHAGGVWLDPTLGSFRIFAPGRWADIQAGFARLVPSIRRIGLPLLAGTDLGSRGIVPGRSLHDELELLVDAGFTPAEVLRFATVAPARFLGLDDSLGQVAPGHLADFVLLEADPLTDIRNTRRIAAVIRAGTPIDSAMTAALRETPAP
jgi:imidazolonepropionase-like amidohydrolase